MTMDSGSSVFVIPSGWLKMFAMRESAGSKRGQTYQAAAKGGKPIVNEGEKEVKFYTNDGEKRRIVCQVARVNKLLASIGEICDKGNDVIFRRDGGDIIHLQSGKRTPFRRHGNVYVMDAWIKNPNWVEKEHEDDDGEGEALTFTRQGVSR